ncbi:MAG: hypothetical protein ACRC14_07625 [Paracoccaceae bacterium]
MKFGKLAQSVAVGLCMSAGIVFADSATYSPGRVNCANGDCSSIVMNDDGIGIIVEGKNKRKTRKAAEAAAAELNTEAGGFADPCFQDPAACLE